MTENRPCRCRCRHGLINFRPQNRLEIVSETNGNSIDRKLYMWYNKHDSYGGELKYEYCRAKDKRT